MATFTKLTGQGSGPGMPPKNTPVATANQAGTSSISAGSPMVTSKATPSLGQVGPVLALTGTSATEQLGVKSVGEKPAARAPGENENVSSSELGKTGGRPDASGGSGIGRQSKSVEGKLPTNKHMSGGAIKGGIPPGFSGKKGA